MSRESLDERLQRLTRSQKKFGQSSFEPLRKLAEGLEEDIKETERALGGDINAQVNIVADDAEGQHDVKIAAVADQILDGEVGFHPQSVAKALIKTLGRKPTKEEIEDTMVTAFIAFKANQTDSGEE